MGLCKEKIAGRRGGVSGMKTFKVLLLDTFNFCDIQNVTGHLF